MTPETKNKISIALKGNKNGIGNKASTGITPWNKGIRVSEEHKKHLSKVQQGKHNSPQTEIKKGQRIGIKTEFKKGHLTHSWKGGIDAKYRVKNAPRPKPDICELCGRSGRICLDHCHKTGKFRGWLCILCNSALGMVGDSQEILLKMVKYLKDNGK